MLGTIVSHIADHLRVTTVYVANIPFDRACGSQYSQRTWTMFLAVRARDPPRPAGRPGLKTFVVLSILFSVLPGRGPLPVALAQTQTPNDSVVDKWLHELYSVFGIGPGGSRTLVPTSTATSTASASASSSSTQARNQTQKAPSERQGGDGSGSAHGATPDGPASSTNGTSTSNGTSSRDHGRAVFANFVVRNTEKYTVDCWMEGALRHPPYLKKSV